MQDRIDTLRDDFAALAAKRRRRDEIIAAAIIGGLAGGGGAAALAGILYALPIVFVTAVVGAIFGAVVGWNDGEHGRSTWDDDWGGAP